MAYLQATIRVTQDKAEEFSDLLMEYGALSAAIQDAFAGTDKEQAIFGEPDEPTEQIWAESLIICLFAQDEDVAKVVDQVCQQMGGAKVSFQLETIEDQDWVRLTQSQFEPIEISERLRITPTWHEAPNDPNIINLALDPGLAFGTGSHPTTRLCLLWLDQHLKAGQSVLDYGCGSGILAIAAAKIGASKVVGVDIDKQAIIASKDNALKNHIDHATFLLPDKVTDELFDVVLANILANPLRVLGQMLATKTKSGGQIVLSGILQDQAEELMSIYEQWFHMAPPVFLDGWSCLTGIKK
ncbi:50S ribosomal protein L11 methyltransferase [Neisseria sp. Ec49-e6-T10]|uniref:50S ribosomal protein L11 methyltransferase n=1 Tax=Neisseria sp. Ec49-e6-T10 TaxID=3140744 RepID=UPI003EC13932